SFQRGVTSGAERHAVAAEVRITAENPSAIADFDRGGLVVEADIVEVGLLVVDDLRVAVEVLLLIEHDGVPIAFAVPVMAPVSRAYPAYRGDPVFQPQIFERAIAAGVEHDALAVVVRAAAELPRTFLDFQRRHSVVEAHGRQVSLIGVDLDRM